MRRKNIVITITILLVLGLGCLAWYHRQTRDIEFEVPGMLSGLWMDGNSHAIANHFVAYQDDEDNLIVYDILKKIRTQIDSDTLIEKLVICDPWIVWEKCAKEKFIVTGYNLLQAQAIPICENEKESLNPEMDRDIVVWSENKDIYGYDLQKKTKFPISMDPQREGEPDISGDFIVWKKYANDPWNTQIVGYNLKTQKQFMVRDKISTKRGLRVCDHYIIWQELKLGQEDNRYCLMAYSIESEEVMTICAGMDNNFGVDISDDIVVWDNQGDGGCFDIFGYNLKIRQLFPICSEENDQFIPKISGNTVIWIDMREQDDWLSQLLKKEPSQIRGKSFRRWPGEEKTK